MAPDFEQIKVRDLRFFDRLARLGTITATAHELGIPKPTASRWLAQLEERVGALLVRRTSRHAALTPRGVKFHAQVKEVLAVLASVERSLSDEPTGTVRVSVPVPLGKILGGRVIAGFRRKLPSVRLEIALQNHRVDLVRDGFDVAIRGGPLPNSELIARKLGRTPLSIYASSYYAGSTLEEIPWLALPGDERMMRSKHPGLPPPVVVIDDRGALGDALVAGAGAGILPAFLGEPACELGTMVRLDREPLAHMLVHALFLPTQRQDQRIRVLIDEIGSVLGPTLAGEGQTR